MERNSRNTSGAPIAGFRARCAAAQGRVAVPRDTDFLNDLNSVQQRAVRHPDGPLLVLAGAGSGKTRVLTYRIAFLVSRLGVNPRSILAVTFTNKAADQMKLRVARLIGGDARLAWIGTFHSICARLLRLEARWGWWTPGFSIYDEKDQLDLIKESMTRAGVATSTFAPKAILSEISRAKDRLLTAQTYTAQADNYFRERVAKVYAEYERALVRNNAFDFDDLIMRAVELLRARPRVLDAYAGRFEHVLVDEYQDTSHAQYALVSLLSSRHRNICVVGDDDQSIYGWRGADITNILDFEEDHPDSVVLRLEQNYRSTKGILAAAHDVVSRNVRRKEKTLWTERPQGLPVTLARVASEYQEADTIRDRIIDRMSAEDLSYRGFAVLYRTHAQSRVIEDSLRRAGIAYDIIGGVRFYERAEVKDALAYLKVVANPADDVSFGRIVNVPPRRIGDRAIARMREFASGKRLTLYDSMRRSAEIHGLTAAAKRSLEELAAAFESAAQASRTKTVSDVLNGLLAGTGYVTWLEQQKTEESAQRLANVQELAAAASEFAEAAGESGLIAFLEHVSLVTNIDQWEDGANAVSLMTLHNAKGLEFPVVMIPGLEDGLLPHESSFEDEEEMEEERRLFYVGMTRAMDELYLFAADTRRRGSALNVRSPSRFIDEIEPDHLHVESLQPPTWGGARRSGAARDGVFPDYEGYSQEVREICPGATVTHPTWGSGVVLEVSGGGRDAIVTVRFRDDTEKRIMLGYGKLKLVSD